MKCLGKCGVNTFSIGTDCYLEETLNTTSPPIPVAVGQTQPTESTTKEPALICKDSCPLDGKCYLMGYRKSGGYCSDSGGFTDQLEGDKACDNNFECSSNVCVSGRCISEGLLQKVLDWFKNLFG